MDLTAPAPTTIAPPPAPEVPEPEPGPAEPEPATIGEGSTRFSHSGEGYLLGFGADFFGIWDRTRPGGAVARFPRTNDGWEEAWRRFVELEPRAIEVPTRMTPPPDVRARTAPFRPTRTLARWIVALLGVVIAFAVLAVAFRIHHLSLINRVRHGELVSEAQGRASANRVNTMAVLVAVGYVTTGVVWLVWHFRAQRNVSALGATNLKYRPGWAVGWWLIPMANVAMPYLTMRELYKASAPDAGAVDWAAARTPALLPLWWGCVVGRLVLASIGATVAAGKRSGLSALAAFAARDGLYIAGDTLLIVGGLLAIVLVRTIQRRLDEKQAKMHSIPAPAGASWYGGVTTGA